MAGAFSGAGAATQNDAERLALKPKPFVLLLRPCLCKISRSVSDEAAARLCRTSLLSLALPDACSLSCVHVSGWQDCGAPIATSAELGKRDGSKIVRAGGAAKITPQRMREIKHR